jgi:hypothetical protein
MTIGSNETRYGWMDEGFNDYIDDFAVAAHNNTPMNVASSGTGYRRIAGTELEAPMMWPTDFAGPYAGTATYSKAPLALYALGAVAGDSAVHHAFAHYAVTWKFKHPTPWDFFMSVNHSLGQNLDWFWFQWFFTNYTVDQAIHSVTVTRENAAIVVQDKGEMAMPVIVRVDYSDGTSATVSRSADVWFSGTRSVTMSVPLRGRTIKSVTLDPDNRFQDLNRTNNSWSRTVTGR